MGNGAGRPRWGTTAMAEEQTPTVDSPELAPITPEQAQAILADEELRAQCQRDGVDLTLIVDNLKASVPERLDRLAQGVKLAASLYDAGTRMGLHG